MTRVELVEYTHDGDCDKCGFYLSGECHLQCTHEVCEDDEELEKKEDKL